MFVTNWVSSLNCRFFARIFPCDKIKLNWLMKNYLSLCVAVKFSHLKVISIEFFRQKREKKKPLRNYISVRYCIVSITSCLSNILWRDVLVFSLFFYECWVIYVTVMKARFYQLISTILALSIMSFLWTFKCWYDDK